MSDIFSKSNPVFSSFAFYSTILVLKMFCMIFVTIYHRLTKKVFITPEDIRFNDPDGKKNYKIVKDNIDVERVRRAHLNDTENILPFILLGFFYVTTNPSPFYASILFRVFAAARIIHSVVYLLEIPQPARALSFFGGVGVNLIMTVHILMYYLY